MTQLRKHAPSFGPALALLRRSKGLTQTELAHLAKLSPSQVSRWESGRTVPREESIDRYLEIVEATWEELAQAQLAVESSSEPTLQGNPSAAAAGGGGSSDDGLGSPGQARGPRTGPGTRGRRTADPRDGIHEAHPFGAVARATDPAGRPWRPRGAPGVEEFLGYLYHQIADDLRRTADRLDYAGELIEQLSFGAAGVSEAAPEPGTDPAAPLRHPGTGPADPAEVRSPLEFIPEESPTEEKEASGPVPVPDPAPEPESESESESRSEPESESESEPVPEPPSEET